MKNTEQLISTLVHDVNNHLSGTQSYLELLLSGSLNEAQTNKLGLDLLALTKHTAVMLANILNWSRIAGNQLATRPGPLALGDVIRQALEDQQSVAQNKNITLTLAMSREVSVIADAGQLYLVLRNLLSNAIKFSHPGGSVLVSIQDASGEAVIQIRDKGIGISPEGQQELFVPGWKTTFGTRNEKGLGIGLWLCKELLQRQNGRVWYQPLSTEGSIFSLAIPLA